MGDALYGAGMLIFFALMAAYGRGCEILGHDDTVDPAAT